MILTQHNENMISKYFQKKKKTLWKVDVIFYNHFFCVKMNDGIFFDKDFKEHGDGRKNYISMLLPFFLVPQRTFFFSLV